MITFDNSKLPKTYDGFELAEGQLAYEHAHGKIMVLSVDHDGSASPILMKRSEHGAAGATPKVTEIMEYLLWFKLRKQPAPLENELRALAKLLKTSG